MYLTYEEYLLSGGKEMDDTVYARLEMKARRLIDAMTRGRVQNESPAREGVKMAVYELVCALAGDEANGGVGGRQIASMANDDLRVEYADRDEAGGDRYAGIVRAWLRAETDAAGVQLLYAGA